jgi:hypothetical protein
VFELSGGDHIASEQQSAREHWPESIEEQVQVAERWAQQASAGHAHLGVATGDRDVRHECQLEAAAERVGLDLSDRHLGELGVLVVERERLTIDTQAAPLAGAACLALVVPAVGVVHVGAGREDALCAAQDEHLDGVVGGHLVE